MLTSLQIEQFRCLENARLEFDPRATGITGSNASGKTSLLEAIYFLGHGRSFRVAQRDRLIRSGAERFRLVGRIRDEDGESVVGVEYASSGLQLHLAGQSLTGFSEVAARIPLQVIDPGVHRLIEEGSTRRRRLLDWGVFHVKHDFLLAWRRYQRALRQRNAALRAGSPWGLIEMWDGELAASAATVDKQRELYLEMFIPEFSRWAGVLVGNDAGLNYRRGWRSESSLSEALADSRAQDLRVRTTTVGAHRADLQFTIAGAPARDRISRGQQKMLASSFVLAQVALRATQLDRPTCLLVDDPAAELDVDNLGKLLRALVEVPAQLVVTAVNETGLRGLPMGRRFHVEQGRLHAML